MTRLSGITPSGRIQLGNYLGAIRHWAAPASTPSGTGEEVQDDVYFVSDLHAKTTAHNPSRLRSLAPEQLAAGITNLVDILAACTATTPEAAVAGLGSYRALKDAVPMPSSRPCARSGRVPRPCSPTRASSGGYGRPVRAGRPNAANTGCRPRYGWRARDSSSRKSGSSTRSAGSHSTESRSAAVSQRNARCSTGCGSPSPVSVAA